MSKFKDKYALADTEVIELEDVKFHVRLPTSANRQYERAVAAAATEYNPETGTYRPRQFKMDEVFSMQHSAFVRSCVVKVEGLDDFDKDTFCDNYPDAAEDLYKAAMERAVEVEQEATAEMGKSPTTSDGQSDGLDENSSIEVLNSQAG